MIENRVRNCVLNKVTSVYLETLNISCAVGFRTLEAALKKGKNIHQIWFQCELKVSKSQYCHCMQGNMEEEDATLGPASPVRGLVAGWLFLHPHLKQGWILRPVPRGRGLVPQFQPDPPCLTSWGCFHAQSQWKHPRSCSNIWRLNCLTLFIHLRLIQTRFLDKCCYKWIKRATKCKEGLIGSHLLLTNSAQV